MPELLEGGRGEPQLLLSAKDTAAPSLAEAVEGGLLPLYDDCVAHYRSLT